MSTLANIPSLEALHSRDDRRLDDELRALAARQQIAVVRTLLDELERAISRAVGAQAAIRDQLVHELARLGCRTLDTAASVACGENSVCA